MLRTESEAESHVNETSAWHIEPVYAYGPTGPRDRASLHRGPPNVVYACAGRDTVLAQTY